MNNFIETKLIRWFIQSAGAILLAAALVRFAMAAAQLQILSLPEPILGIPLRYAVLGVGCFELAVALICLFGRKTGLQLGWLAWMTANYCGYWIGVSSKHCYVQATCIGNFTDQLQLGSAAAIFQFIPIYFLLGSCAALLWLRLAGAREKTAKYVNMCCPSCGVRIHFDGRNLGQKIPCPHCQSRITLRRPDNLKMSCFFCQEHIEFPTHAIGDKIPCPHCKMDITLKEPV